MNGQLQQYVSPDPDFNISYSNLRKLISRLRVLGVAVTNVTAIPNPGTGSFKTVQELRDMGMEDGDLLNYAIQVNGSDSWHTAAQDAAELAPLTAIAVYRVLSDLAPGNVQAALGSALMVLPGIDALIAQALA